MHRRTEKQREASRRNGRKGNGPKTDAGKEAVKFNAAKEWLFTRELVVEAAGERQVDFDRVTNEMLDHIDPQNSLEETFVSDLVENWWRKKRVRRAESIDLQKRLAAASISGLLGSQKTRSLQARFLSCWEKYNLLSSSRRDLEALEMADELEVTRQELAATSDGIAFLIHQMEQLESVVEAVGYMPPESAILLPACLGFGDPTARLVLAINSTILKQSGSGAKAEQPENSDADLQLRSLAEELKSGVETSNSDHKKVAKTKAPEDNKEDKQAPIPEENRKVLLMVLRVNIRRLDMEKQVRVAAEQVEAEARRAAAIVSDRSDRFLRAETTYERRFYRALLMLMNLRDSGNLGSSMPPPPQYARLIQAEPGQEKDSKGNRRKVARRSGKKNLG